jgi:hypothetical protein
MTLNSRQLTATLIATLVMLTMSSSAHADALSSYRAAVMADAPLAYWHLDETLGTTAADSSGGAATGAMSGGIALGVAPPFSAPANRAMRFDAGGTMTAQVPGTAKAVEFWVRPSQRVQQTFVTFGDPSAASGWSIGLSGSKTTRNQRRRIQFTSGGRVTSARMSLPIGSWSMVSVSWGPGTTLRFTVNGRTVTRTPFGGGVPTSSNALGAFVVGPGAGTGGTSFDEVALFGTRPDPATHFVSSALPVLVTAPVLAAPSTVAVGQPISITPGSWSPGTTVTDVWQRCDSIGACQTIPGATGPSYTPQPADAGFILQLQETAVSPTGATVIYTDATEPITLADGSQPANAPLLPPGTDPAVPASETQAAIDAGGVSVVDPVADAAAAADDPAGDDGGSADPVATAADGGTIDVVVADEVCVARTQPVRSQRLKLRRMGRRGRVTVRVDSGSSVVTVAAKRGVVRRVRWTLDGAKLSGGRGTALRLPELAEGSHVLRGKVAGRRGTSATVTLRISSACS